MPSAVPGTQGLRVTAPAGTHCARHPARLPGEHTSEAGSSRRAEGFSRRGVYFTASSRVRDESYLLVLRLEGRGLL